MIRTTVYERLTTTITTTSTIMYSIFSFLQKCGHQMASCRAISMFYASSMKFTMFVLDEIYSRARLHCLAGAVSIQWIKQLQHQKNAKTQQTHMKWKRKKIKRAREEQTRTNSRFIFMFAMNIVKTIAG